MRRTSRLIVLLLCCFPASFATAQVPATNRTARPEIRTAFLGLTSSDFTTRDKAAKRLMALKREDLPALRAVAAEFKPIDPILASTLRDVVTHVYAAGHPYPRDVLGFLGITMAVGEEASDEAVMIKERKLGFVGYRVFEDGDAIVDIEERPLTRGPDFQTRFSRAVSQFGAGKTLHFKVLRRGEIVTVEVPLDARPVDLSGGMLEAYSAQVDKLQYQRREEAQAYWDQQFAPLVQSPTPAQAAVR